MTLEIDESNLKNYLNQYEVLNPLPSPFKVYLFTSGEALLPIKSEISAKLIKLWSSALARDVSDPLVLEDSEKYSFKDDDMAIVVVDSNNTDFASIFLYRRLFNAENSQTPEGIYLNICLVDQRYQGKGITSKLIQKSIEDIRPKYLVLHTQNELMVQTLRKFVTKGNLFPIDGQLPTELDFLKTKHTENLDNFNPITMIENSLYCKGNPLLGDRIERHSVHQDIREFFQNNVNFQRGDAVLVVGILLPNKV